MKLSKLLILAALSACCSSVFAQWQWIDESGKKVFSDRPPPTNIDPSKILKRPRHAAVVAQEAPVAATEGEEAAGATLPQEQVKGPVVDPVLRAQKAKQEAQEKAQAEAKRRAEETRLQQEKIKLAKIKQENCARARNTQAVLQSGMRVAHVNEKGERGFMSDAQRQAEMRHAQEAIGRDCAQ